MPTQRSLELREKGELIQSVDTARAGTDPFKLLAAMRTELDNRLLDATTKDTGTLTSEAARAEASATVRTTFDTLKDRLRDGFNFVQGIPGFQITPAARLGLFTSYGWEQGEIGDLTDVRAEMLANQAIAVTPTIPNPAHRYSTALLTIIQGLLDTINLNQPIATGGAAQGLTTARNLALDKLDAIIDRVRFYYCSCSDERDQTDELTKIGFLPRRDRGDAQQQQLPGPMGAATFNTATLNLSAAALPDGATSLHAIRQVLGGQPELAGVGGPGNLTVSVVQISPLTPGATYEFWLVGHNGRGDGPESNHVTHAVPVGP